LIAAQSAAGESSGLKRENAALDKRRVFLLALGGGASSGNLGEKRVGLAR
jgi:hypothetical protein